MHATVKNNTSFELVPHATAPSIMWHGDSAGGPTRIGPNTASGNAGTYIAAQNTWTGTSGTILYSTPDENAILALFFNLPYVGHNTCAVSTYSAIQPYTPSMESLKRSFTRWLCLTKLMQPIHMSPRGCIRATAQLRISRRLSMARPRTLSYVVMTMLSTLQRC